MRAAGEGGKEAKGKGRVAVAVAQRRRCLLQLLLLLLPAVARGWHASLGQRATPVVHATSQRGDLELPRAQDVIHDPCLTVTTTVHKLHLVCNATCATRMPCDWGCQATWNSFLRDVHGIEDTECPGYVEYLEQNPLGDSLVPLPRDSTLISRGYLSSLVHACRRACPQHPDAELDYPCSEDVDFPLAPTSSDCTGGEDSFNVTDGKHWYPFVTWGVVAYYKRNNMGNTGGLYGVEDADRDDNGLEKNEYSSWACLWEESCGAMKQDRKMACFRYSHLRGEFHWWKWSDTSPELKSALDVWTVYASFCNVVPDADPRLAFIDARDRSKVITPSAVEYSFKRLHVDGAYRPAISGLLSDLGDGGCDVLKLQRGLQYLLEVNGSDYLMSIGHWISPSKDDLAKWASAGNGVLPVTVPMFPKRSLECSSLAFTLSWCTTSPTDLDLVLFKPNQDSANKMFVPDTLHAVMNGKRMAAPRQYKGPFQSGVGVSYSIELEMDDDGMYYDDEVRTYGPETIYTFGDLPEGTYAVMAYVLDSNSRFTGGCERITMYSGMPGRDRQVASVSVGEKVGTGNWWHAFNIRIKNREVSDQHGQVKFLKGFEYAVVDTVYSGPVVCNQGCGIGGDAARFVFQPSFQDMKEEWKRDGEAIDPRETRSASYLDEEEDGYKTLFFYAASSRTCELASYIEIRALDALTHTYLSDATFRINDELQSYKTSKYRLTQDVAGGGYVGGFMVPQGEHKFEVSRPGYKSEIYKIVVPQRCEGSNCLPMEIIYRELYMIPNDGKTRVVLEWGDTPFDLDIVVMPVGVLGLNGEQLVWKTRSGSDVKVYDTSDTSWDAESRGTTNYGDGREPYASRLLTDGAHSMQEVTVDGCMMAPKSLCRCEHTCREGTSHPFVCTHYESTRRQCSAYEDGVLSVLLPGYPSSKAGQAPLCVDIHGNIKQACCCNPPDADGFITCEDGASDAWCCPTVDEIPSSFCQPTCSMHTANTTIRTAISIDRNENYHNMPKEDTDCKYVNRPEVATLSNLVPGMYKIYVNAFPPSGGGPVFETATSVEIYLGNGRDRTVFVDSVKLSRGTAKWFYAGYIMVTSRQQSCLATNKMLQENTIDGHKMCYTWYGAGYHVNSPLALQYGAVRIRIAAASGRSHQTLPDFSGVQYSVHAGGSCTCMPEGGVTGCRCIGSALVHAGVLGPTGKSIEVEDDWAAEGWATAFYPIFFPVESGRDYWMIFTEDDYFGTTLQMGAVNAYTPGASMAVQSVVMTDRVDEGQLRIVFSWKAISDGDMYVFRGALPICHENEEGDRRRREISTNCTKESFVWWGNVEGLDSVRLEQDCTTKECGVETIFFDDSPVHDGMVYTVAANVYAGVGQSSDDGKCDVSSDCNFAGTYNVPDEIVQFFGAGGRIAEVKYESSGARVDWWYVAEVYRQNSVWVVQPKNMRAYCTPSVDQPDIDSFMSPECTVEYEPDERRRRRGKRDALNVKGKAQTKA